MLAVRVFLYVPFDVVHQYVFWYGMMRQVSGPGDVPDTTNKRACNYRRQNLHGNVGRVGICCILLEG
jgi:hypothetical protein